MMAICDLCVFIEISCLVEEVRIPTFVLDITNLAISKEESQIALSLVLVKEPSSQGVGVALGDR